MFKSIVRILAIVGAVVLIGTFVAILLPSSARRAMFHPRQFSKPTFEHALMEDVPDTPTARLMLADKQTLRDVVDAIDRGATDDRVAGMIAKIGAAPMGMAQTQEIPRCCPAFSLPTEIRRRLLRILGEVRARQWRLPLGNRFRTNI